MLDLKLELEELDVMNGFVQHGGRVHLGAARNQPLQDADAITDPLAAMSSSHALRVLGDLHIASLGARLSDLFHAGHRLQW